MARKQLNADVRAFLKGDQAPEAETQATTSEKQEKPSAEDKTLSTPKTGNSGMLAEILGSEPQSEAIIRYTADLPESLHQRLSYAAVTSRTTKIKLLRQILDKVLPDLPT
ncbi:MAG: hypothetical protein WA984_10485 [Phormidesmis sp.]